MQTEMPLVQLVRLKLPRDALFSGRTAAWLHGLDFPPCDPIEVTLPRASRTSRLARVSLTRSDFSESEISKVQGLAATSSTRTAADLARRLPLVDAVAALDMALHRRIVDIRQLRRWADSHARYRGVGRLRHAIELSDAAAESPMETRLRLLLVSSGLPKPGVQVPLYDETGFFIARPDLFYATKRLALEYDGRSHRKSLVADNRRQNRLLEAGYRLLRFTAGDILNSPGAVIGLVSRALATSRAE